MHNVTNLDSHHIIHFGDVFFYSRFRSFSALFLFPLEFLDHHSVSSYESPPYETSYAFDLPIVRTIEKLKTTSVILGYHKGTPRQNLFFEKLLTITLRAKTTSALETLVYADLFGRTIFMPIVVYIKLGFY